MEISSEIRKPSLIGMTRAELSAALCALGVPDKQLRMRVNQIWGWLYAHGVREFDQMSNVAGICANVWRRIIHWRGSNWPMRIH